MSSPTSIILLISSHTFPLPSSLALASAYSIWPVTLTCVSTAQVWALQCSDSEACTLAYTLWQAPLSCVCDLYNSGEFSVAEFTLSHKRCLKVQSKWTDKNCTHVHSSIHNRMHVSTHKLVQHTHAPCKRKLVQHTRAPCKCELIQHTRAPRPGAENDCDILSRYEFYGRQSSFSLISTANLRPGNPDVANKEKATLCDLQNHSPDRRAVWSFTCITKYVIIFTIYAINFTRCIIILTARVNIVTACVLIFIVLVFTVSISQHFPTFAHLNRIEHYHRTQNRSFIFATP